MDRRILFAIAVVIGAVLVGAGAYQAGLAQGVATAGQGGAAAVPYGYYHPYGYGFGFGFLGLLFPLAFILLLFAAFRGARGGGRNWGDRRGMLDDWHRRAHDDQGRTGDVGTPAPR